MANVTNPTKTSTGASIPLLWTDIDGTNYAPAVSVVGFADTVVSLAISTDSDIYAANDVLFATQELAGMARIAAGTGTIVSIELTDRNDQGVAMDLVFLNSNASIGAENAGVGLAASDAATDAIIGTVNIATTDYADLGSIKVATKRSVGLEYKCAAGTTSLWVGGVTRGGTPTHTATGLSLKVGILRG